MIQRGRKSPHANVVALPTPTRSRLTPPTTLTVSERKIFNETAAGHPHLTPRDATVLAAFAQASVRSFKLSKTSDTKAWESSVRAMLALARSLRLTPISSIRPENLGRQQRNTELQRNAAALGVPPWSEKYDEEEWPQS